MLRNKKCSEVLTVVHKWFYTGYYLATKLQVILLIFLFKFLYILNLDILDN